MSSAQINWSRRPARSAMPLCFATMMRWESKKTGGPKPTPYCIAAVADGEMPTASWIVSGFQRGQRLRLGGKDLNRQAVRRRPEWRWRLRGKSRRRGGKIAVDVLPVPIVDALRPCRNRNDGRLGSPRAFAPARRRSATSRPRAKSRVNYSETHQRSLDAIPGNKTDGSLRLPSDLRYPRLAAEPLRRGTYQGVQVPEVGVPGDAVGRGLTSAGYGSIGSPFL